MGALPYYCSGYIPVFSDALFESVSGWTTTGVTVLRDIEALPNYLLLWRALSQWLGGMGILLITAALLPSIGSGAMLIFQTRASDLEEKKAVPYKVPASRLLLIYTGLTFAEVILLGCFGMNWFDAIGHSFSTISTGGFSAYNNSIAHFNSPAIERICALFMLLAGFNFFLMWRLLQGKFSDLLHNSEAKVWAAIVCISGLLTAVSILPDCHSFEAALRKGFFNTASIISTTGFANTDTGALPALAQTVLFALLFLGGCAGSTAGGIKVFRYTILAKQALIEMKKIVHPKGIFAFKLNGKSGGKELVYPVIGFIFLYLITLFTTSFLVSSAGSGVFDSFKTALICLGNNGQSAQSLGAFSSFFDYPAYVKWGLSLVMLLGRFELWIVIIFFPRGFFRR